MTDTLIDPTELKSGNVKVDNSEENEDFLTDMLTRKIYERPAEAVVREYLANAYDSQIEAGTDFTKHPVEITIPTSDSPNLIIQDFGLGLSREDMIKYLITLVASLKRKSKKATGHMGIGAKSAQAIAKSYIAESNHNGTRTVMTIYKKEFGGLGYQELFHGPTDEPNGLKIIIPVDSNNLRTQIELAILRTVVYWPSNTINIKFFVDDIGEMNKSFEDKDGITKIYDNSDIKAYLSKEHQSRPNIVMGYIKYELPRILERYNESNIVLYNDINKASWFNADFFNRLTIVVPNKEFTPLPSRENIVVDNIAGNKLNAYLEDIEKAHIKNIQNEIDNATKEKTIIALNTISKHNTFNSRYSDFKYNGISLKNIENLTKNAEKYVIDTVKKNIQIRHAYYGVEGYNIVPLSYYNKYTYPRIIIEHAPNIPKTAAALSKLINYNDFVSDEFNDLHSEKFNLMQDLINEEYRSKRILIYSEDCNEYEKTLPETVIFDGRELLEEAKKVDKAKRELNKQQKLALFDIHGEGNKVANETITKTTTKPIKTTRNDTIKFDVTKRSSNQNRHLTSVVKSITEIINDKPDIVYVVKTDNLYWFEQYLVGTYENPYLIGTKKGTTVLCEELKKNNIKHKVIDSEDIQVIRDQLFREEIKTLPTHLRKLISPSNDLIIETEHINSVSTLFILFKIIYDMSNGDYKNRLKSKKLISAIDAASKSIAYNRINKDESLMKYRVGSLKNIPAKTEVINKLGYLKHINIYANDMTSNDKVEFSIIFFNKINKLKINW